MPLEQTVGKHIAGISSMATRHVLAELAGDYERQSGQRVAVESIGGLDAVRRVEAGEPFDFVVLAAESIERLSAAGRIVPGSRIDFARSGVAIAVAAGAPRPDIGDERAVRQTVLNARRIGYSTGPSGAHLARLFERWGIAEAIAPRLVQAPPGVPVGSLVARDEVDLGFQQLSELKHVAGIDVIGSLPSEVQIVTVFCAAVCSKSTRPEVVDALLRFLASPAADSVKRRHGMEPSP